MKNKIWILFLTVFLVAGLMPISIADNHNGNGASGGSTSSGSSGSSGSSSSSGASSGSGSSGSNDGTGSGSSISGAVVGATPTRIAAEPVAVRTMDRDRLENELENCKDTEGEDKEECEARIKKQARNVVQVRLTQAQIQALQGKREEITNRIQELRDSDDFFKYKTNFKARELAKERLQKAAEKFQQAKKKYQENKQKREDALDKFRKAKNSYKACEDDDSDECEQTRARIHEGAIEYLQKTLGTIENQIEKVQSRVNSSEDLTEEEAKDILEKLAELQADVDLTQDKADALDENSTKEDIDEVKEEVRELWRNAAPLLQRNIQSLIHSKVGGLIAQINSLENRINNAIDKMDEQGMDTSELTELMEDFDNHISNASSYYREARILLLDDNKMTEEVRDLLEKSKEEIESAREVLREILKKMKELKSDDLIEEEDEEEAEDESDDTDDDSEDADDNDSDDEDSDDADDDSDDDDEDDDSDDDEDEEDDNINETEAS